MANLLCQAVLKHVVSKKFIFKKSVQGTTSVFYQENEEVYDIIFHIKIFHVMLKRNFNMWVTSGSYVGHIQIVLCVSGSYGSTGVTHFQPW